VAIIAAMGTASLFGLAHSTVRVDGSDPDLRLFKLNVYVRDQDRSLDFYVHVLGFKAVADVAFPGGGRWVAVAPPDGTGVLALMLAEPSSKEEELIGRTTQLALISEDIEGTYQRWQARGVKFDPPPKDMGWGGTFARFADVDGNWFELVGSNYMNREIEAQRRTAMQKMEAERRVAQELEIAKEVQARLFPQSRPVMRTLEYAGICRQARQVGGDYFDFLALGQNAVGNCRVGLMVGDVSGKGIAAALLMANLQANVRSQSAMAVDHPECMLASVNELFYANSTAGSYATLFFAEYEDGNSLLSYANCGHLPGLVLRNDDSVTRLEATGKPLGLFGNWDCAMREFRLEAGDLLLLYTDGVTESFNEAEEEFGEERLIEAARACRDVAPAAMVEEIADAVRRFSVGEQFDDITLIVARCGG